MYLDDEIFAVKGKDKAMHKNRMVQSDLSRAGLMKSPTKTVVWLDFQIDLQEGHLTTQTKTISLDHVGTAS